uniref:Microsomal triglyceride transfer protein large subunit n=1 Tax=Cacopsylla melanoneura TaxID=428564 RepID=A0A8D8QVR0_9HEMI
MSFTVKVISSFLLVLLFCGSYCQMIPVAALAASTAALFPPGSSQVFNLETTVLLNEPSSPTQGGFVGYQVKGDVLVNVKWVHPSRDNEKLLQIQIRSPKLYIQSRDGSIAESFTQHKSKLDKFPDQPFLAHWSDGIIKHIYLNDNEDIFTRNLKKGVASTFQVLLEGGERSETDASGTCKVSYKAIDSANVFKRKRSCVTSPDEFPFRQHFEKVWRPIVNSKRECVYTLSKEKTSFTTIASEEQHEMRTANKQETGAMIMSRQHLTSVDFSASVDTVTANTVEEAVNRLSLDLGIKVKRTSLRTERDTTLCKEESCPSIVKTVKEHKALLREEYLGSTRSAAAFLKVLTVARSAPKEDLVKVLKNTKNKKIMNQLYDIMGAAQTDASHEAVNSVLTLTSEEDFDFWERYLWSLSFGAYPSLKTIQSIESLNEKRIDNPKLKETLLLTLTAMVRRYDNYQGDQKHEVLLLVLKNLERALKDCPEKEEDSSCALMYLRAFKNLNHEATLPTLLKYAVEGSKKSSVAAMKAIRALPPSAWSPLVQKTAANIYYQLDRRYDSSARTLALDILLESKPLDEERIKHLLVSLKNRDPVYEVKQYLLQRLNQLSESYPDLRESVTYLLKSLGLNHYGVLAQRGLSTALSRSFMTHPDTNGTLLSIQEISGGILKRGTVDVMVESSNETQPLFSLGLFAGGLSSYMSSGDDKTEGDTSSENNESEEVATAGMELTVLGVQIRPFVFFTGQGQLMGHVWSGTASEKTPAFQILTLIHDHSQFIPLEGGFIAELSLHGGLSFELGGLITMSLWNRNAQSLVEKRAGISILGGIRVDTNFVRSFVTYNISSEVELSLSSDINFYNKIAMCMQLKQPDSVIRHNIHKVERIPGSKHRLRKSKYSAVTVPGKTYALNRKNNEMCSTIFADES